MRSLLAVLLCLHSSWALTGQGVVYPGRNDLFELSILHINDFHARFEQIGPTSGPCNAGEEKNCIGGIARVSTIVKQLKQERPNSIFLNAGDHYQGTLWFNLHRWNVTATFMNELPHDAMTVGNHDFDDRIEGIVPFLKHVKSPVVLANVDDSEEPTIQGLYHNSTIIVKNGVKIGIIGIILSTTNQIANTGDLKFLDEVKTVNEEAARLKHQGVNIIIVLSHSGLDVDKVMAAQCPDVDVIVGGHSHSFLYSGEAPFNDVVEGDYPVHVKQEGTNRNALIVQAAAFTRYMGNLTVWFDGNGEVVDWDGNPILLDSSIEEDPKIVKMLQPWKEEVDALGAKVIGSTKVLLDSNCRSSECNLGNLITDAMVESYVEKGEDKKAWTYAAVGCYNVGGIRSSIEEMSSNITYSALKMVQPFDNTWDTLEINGTTLREVLEFSVLHSWSNTEFIGRGFLVWSGLKVTYDLSAEPYNRVKHVLIRCRECEIPVYEELEDDKWYRIVLSSYLYGGGDNFVMFKAKGRNHEIGALDMDLLVKYIDKRSPLTAGLDNRLVMTGTWKG